MEYVTPAEDRHGQAHRWRPRLHEVVLALTAIAFLAAKYRLLPTINVNWDEFLYLSRVHEYARGQLSTPFLTFHVHLFQWLTRIGGTEVDQVIAARQFMFALRVGGSILLFLLARRLTSRSGAFVAVLAPLTFAFVLRYGESFRGDSLIAFLVLFAVTLLVLKIESLAAVIASGVAFALAAAITVKTALFAPSLLAVAGILILSADDPALRRMRLRRAALLGAVVVVSYGIMNAAHAAATSAGSGAVGRSTVGAGSGMLGNPALWALNHSLSADWPFWILLLLGVGFAVRDAVRQRGDAQTRALLVLALQLPLSTLFFYRNTFPYYYVTLVPLASVACGYLVASVERLMARRQAWLPVIVLLLAAPIALRGWQMTAYLQADGVATQRALLGAVHAIFSEPVPYLDRCGMVSSFPRANLFMSTYVLGAYRERGVPVMADLVATRQPHFLLANVETLQLQQPWNVVSRYPHWLLPQDYAFLQDNFVHHWGPIWVPGRTLELRDGQEVPASIVVRGTYTVESDRPVVINGVETRPNGLVVLDRGVHRVRGAEGATTVTLRLGTRLHRPGPIKVTGPLFWPL
ncbi:MAG: hypothetical protein WD801_08985 [Gemmatimonadaceae bacterium]